MEFLMKAQDGEISKIESSLTSYLVSPKLDGMRCFWDGGVTKHLKVREVPWANIDKEHATNDYKSTGLWSTMGRPIMCPEWFTQGWPSMPLDGELIWKASNNHLGSFFNEPMHPDLFKDNHQKILSVVKKHEPRDYEWGNICLTVFDSPSWVVFREHRTLKWKQRDDFLNPVVGSPDSFRVMDTYQDIYSKLRSGVFTEPIRSNNLVTCFLLTQTNLFDRKHFDILLDRCFEHGGEGLMLRHSSSFWYPKRRKELLKFKDSKDSEAVICDYEMGKEGLRNQDRLGSLVVSWTNPLGKEVVFNIGIGFTDEERDNYKLLFKVGTEVNFKYRALTEDGIPKEARYNRVRVPE